MKSIRISANAVFLVAAAFCLQGTALAADTLQPGAVFVEHAVNASPERAWQALGHFCAIVHWQSVVAGCDIAETESGILRTVVMTDRSIFIERLDEFSNASHSFSYAMVSGPIQVQGYHASFRIRPAKDDAQALVRIDARFDAPPAAHAAIERQLHDLFDNGMRGIDSMLALPGAPAGPHRQADGAPGTPLDTTEGTPP